MLDLVQARFAERLGELMRQLLDDRTSRAGSSASVARQFSALGGTITAQFDGYYTITCPFQVNDRFISVTPLYNFSAGIVVANIYDYPTANSVRVSFVANEGQFFIANRFFIFVY